MAELPFSSAAERNRWPILERLQSLMPRQAAVLEIGSGTGQHAVCFTRNMPGLTWQPSDTRANLPGLEARLLAEGNERILPPFALDVLSDPWPDARYGAAFSANTAHIMPWEAVLAMIAGVADHLAAGALFFLYGPFNVDQAFTSESNAVFDAQLRAQDPQMGLRDMSAIEFAAGRHQMGLEHRLQMPANNFLLVFERW